MKPIIGITAGEVLNYYFPWLPATQGQRYQYVDAVIHAGGTPVILPITGDGTVLKQLYNLCDGLLLAGGNDVDPALYGKKQAAEIADTEVISRKRDDQELKLIEWALFEDKPVLGICRGMQLLNVYLGGTLYQDIHTDLPDADNHFASVDIKDVGKIVHQLRIDPDTKLAQALSVTKIGTNAQHHQAIKGLGKGLRPTAWTADGIIEAAELTDKNFVVGVQSHPESLEATVEPRWAKLYQAFVEASTPRKA